jgi:hypothetical protein
MGVREEQRPWWESPYTIAAFILLSALPLVWPDIPPLIDLPGHMGRYRIQLDLADSPALARFYQFQWMLIGNLGVDLLVVPLSKILGLELAVKAIVMTIPPLTAAGFLWVAREVHGRVPPTALFALPFAYNFPFIFGFVNCALAMAFAFLAFALWLRLARQGRFMLRAILFVPVSLLIWVTHAFGWGTLALLAFSAELVRQHDKGEGVVRSAFWAGVHCLALAPPIALMLLWRSGQVGGETADWFNLRAKLAWLSLALRDRWPLFDLASLGIVLLVFVEALRRPRLAFSRSLAASALILLLVFILLPRIVFGSAYADMRLAPFIFAVAILAIRPTAAASRPFLRALALAGLAFVLARTGATAISFWLYDRAYDRELAALDHIPRGARTLSFVGKPCDGRAPSSRLDHLPALAIVRREAFSNDQWAMAGAQLLRIRYPEGGAFVSDPSQFVTASPCRPDYRSLDQSLAGFPRDAFDYVWLIDPPAFDPRNARNLRPIWRSGTSILFKVEHAR